MEPSTLRTAGSATHFDMLLRPFHKSTTAMMTCLGTLTLVTVLNLALTLYATRTVQSLLPSTREWSWMGDDFPSELPVELPLAGLSVVNGEDHFSLYDDEEWGSLFPSDGFLHCLDVIRVGYLTNRTHALEHIEHCLRYLRQILVCHADTTLEDDIPQFVDGSWTHSASGVGSVHRCKDWTVLRRWVAEHPSLPL